MQQIQACMIRTTLKAHVSAANCPMARLGLDRLKICYTVELDSDVQSRLKGSCCENPQHL